MSENYQSPQLARVSKVTETVKLNPQNQPIPLVHVEFYVGEHGPFWRDIPKAEFDPIKVKMALDDYARSLAQLTN